MKTITFKKDTYQVFASKVVIQSKLTRRIFFTHPNSADRAGFVWNNGKTQGVSFIHDYRLTLGKKEIVFINEVICNFNKYFKALDK